MAGRPQEVETGVKESPFLGENLLHLSAHLTGPEGHPHTGTLISSPTAYRDPTSKVVELDGVLHNGNASDILRRAHFCKSDTCLLIKHIFLPKRNLQHPTFLRTHDLL